ncbi:MAG: transcriptional repressor LexA [Verrucomicrobiota bacterium]|nr:transcriptional repressor LexA [Verrucomicrobiota bacterium]
MKTLTIRQQEVLGFLQLYMKEQGTWPSFRDIERHFGFKSTNAVMGHIKALENKGHISRIAGRARTFRINLDLGDGSIPTNAFDVVNIAIYGSIPAGYPDGLEPSGEIGRLQIDAETAGIRKSRRCFALKVRGDSMIDCGILDGDTVIVEQCPPKDNDIVAALIDGETTLKRFINKVGKVPYLKAENKNYPTLHPVSELVIQGVATSVVRRLN